MIRPVPRRAALRRLAALAVLPAALAACAVGGAEPPRPPGVGRPQRIAYGPDADAFGELTLPAGEVRGTVVVVHGGFWRTAFGLELGRPLAVDLAGAGFAAWNVEYRRVGQPGGGWPGTFTDVAAAVDALAGPVVAAAGGRLDPARAVVVGHSAGGHLAAWVAARPGLPAGAPGAGPVVRPAGVVSQAGVLDLRDAADRRVGGSAVPDLLGGPPGAVPQRYALASPVDRLPVGVPVVCVHGTDDGNVPIRQSERYVAAAQAAGDPAELVALPGVDHFAVIDPATPAWAACRAAVERILG